MDLVTIGKITGTHHLKGAVKVNLNLDDAEILIDERVLVEKTNGEKQILTVKKLSKLVGDKFTMEFAEINDKSLANLLSGGLVKINRNVLGLDEDEFLLEDLIGLRVVTEKNENIGKVTDIFDTAAHDIIVIEDEKSETMIPYLDNFVKKIDFEKKEIIVEILEGMREEKKEKI